MGDLSPHFSYKEFVCRDCGKSKVDMELIFGLEGLRDLSHKPITIISGFRCPIHNKQEGGVGKSQHMDGKAADIRIIGLTLKEMYNLALQVPEFLNGGIGIYDSVPPFIHVDARGTTARWARVDGKYVGIKESGLISA